MSRFTKNFVYETEFDGDKIKVTFSQMRRKNMLALTPFMKTIDKEIKVIVSAEQQVEFMETAAGILKERIVNMSGLVDINGEPLKFTDIEESVYFTPLFSDLLSELMQRSTLSNEQVKNSVGPLNEHSEA